MINYITEFLLKQKIKVEAKKYENIIMKILDEAKAFFNENLGEKPKKKVASKNKDEMFVKEWLKRK